MAGAGKKGCNALTPDDLLQVAQVLKSNGTDGELVLGFRDIAPEDIDLKEPVFIVFDGLPVPFFIESFTKRGNSKALVHLTDICTQEDVDEIAGKAVYVEKDSLPEMFLEEDGFAALVGWMLLRPTTEDGESSTSLGKTEGVSGMTDTEEGFAKTGRNNTEAERDDAEEMTLMEVGEITDFIDIPNNPCIEVETKNGAVMIPLHEDLVLSIDPENQEIIMMLPDGLI